MVRVSNEVLFTVSSRNDESKLRTFLFDSLSGKVSSSKEARKLIDSGAVTVNGKVERFGCRTLNTGDEVRVRMMSEPKVHERLCVLFEDDSLIVISKPAGCISSIDALARRGALIDPAWHLVHRLDKETSGVLIIAKNGVVQKALEDQFQGREVEKTYLALVVGRPPQREETILAPMSLQRKRGSQAIWQVDLVKGMRAETDYFLKVSHKNASLLKVQPKTGRTHQIRVHLASIGCPVMGDKVYGGVQKGPADRQLLHAYQVQFVHPITGQEIVVKAPLPEDMVRVIRRLFPEKAAEVLCEYS